MKNERYGNELAAKEHLIAGNIITRLDAMVLFGLPDLPAMIRRMRKEGWMIKKRQSSFAAAVKRINEYAVLKMPNNLPIRELQLTEYWLSR
jgi:hypothetical protein